MLCTNASCICLSLLDNEDALSTAETAVVTSVLLVTSICFGMKIGFFVISLLGLSITFWNVLMTFTDSLFLTFEAFQCGRILVDYRLFTFFLQVTALWSQSRSFVVCSVDPLFLRLGAFEASFILNPDACSSP